VRTAVFCVAIAIESFGMAITGKQASREGLQIAAALFVFFLFMDIVDLVK
jgi:hypothetical protein